MRQARRGPERPDQDQHDDEQDGEVERLGAVAGIAVAGPGLAMEALLADPGNDAVLVMNVPTALASATEAAASVVSAVRQHRNRIVPPKPVFGVWLGDRGVVETTLDDAEIPHFQSEADAVRGFMHLVRYREGQDALMAAPPSMPDDFTCDTDAARRIMRRAIAAGRVWLDPLEIAELMAAYAIPITPVALARNPDEAAAAAGEGNWAIGVDSDQAKTAEKDVQDVIITSMVKNVDVAVFDYIKASTEGEPLTGLQEFDLKDGGVSYATTGGKIDDITKELDDYKQQIVDGKITVPSK